MRITVGGIVARVSVTAGVLLLFLAGASSARQGAPPRSLDAGVRSLESMDLYSLPSIDPLGRLAEDAAATKPGPMRYAVPVPVAITPESHGTWEEFPDGSRLWRLRFFSPGATDLNFGFGAFRLPGGASLHVVSEGHDYFEGPYTGRDNKPHGELWTPVVPGERAYLELYVPAARKQEPVLELVHVGTGYRDLFGLSGTPKTHQGSCNIDVICPEGDPWRDQIRSVAVYSLDGSLRCTGQLIADVPGSLRPFFLTARHCGVSAANAPSMVVHWNFESPVCGDLDGGSLADSQTGATFLASRADVDFALLELDDDPDPAFDVFFSGWDRTGTAAVGSVGIHHPRTAEKAISINDDLLTSGASCIAGPGGTPDTHWFVDDWEDGTTEPGSSGSGLWDPATGKLVGFLSGGLAACGNMDSDCYGKFSVAWDGASSAARLRDWLDPGDTGTTMVDGIEPPPVSYSSHSGTDSCANLAANENGIWEPGETIELEVTIVADTAFSNVEGTLSSASPEVTIVNAVAGFPDLVAGVPTTSDAPHFTVELDEVQGCFEEIEFDLTVTADEGGPFELSFSQPVGDALAPQAPVEIPDFGGAGNPGTSDLAVSHLLALTDLDVRVEIDHTFVGDLVVTLKSPLGTEVVLLDRPGKPVSAFGCGDDNMNVTFDDASAFDPEDHCAGTNPWFEGTAAPAGSLADFNGQSTQGTWRLSVSDNELMDMGTIVDWELIATPALVPRCEVCPSCVGPDTVMLSNGAPENGMVDETACVSIEVGPYQLGPAGTMTLTAPLVIFLDDTVIEGELTVAQP